MSERENLKRTITLGHLVGIEVGQSIGAGIFALYALTGARYLRALFPALPVIPTALFLLAFFYLTNLFGARIAMWVQAVLVGILLAALVLFVVLGMPEVRTVHFTPLFPGGVSGFVVASCILTFTVLGANAAVELGDEIIDPARNIPLVILFYVMIGIVAGGSSPWAAEGERSLVAVAGQFLSGPVYGFFIVGGGFLAVITTLNATYLWGTKSLLVISEDGLFPAALGKVDRRFGTPVRFLTLIFLISCAALLAAGDRLETFAAFASLGGIIILVPVMGAALKIRKSHPELYRLSRVPLKGFWYYLAPWAGLVLCLVVVLILLVDLGSHRDGFIFLALFLLWTAGGAIYARSRQKATSCPECQDSRDWESRNLVA